MQKQGIERMDAIDKKIIKLIQGNARLSYNELGVAVELSASAINERLKKLHQQGVITGWEARINPRAIQLDVLAFVQVLIEGATMDRDFIHEVVKMQEVQECHHITGDWSYLLKIRTRDTGHLETIISSKIKTLKGVVRTQTVIALSSSKESSILSCEEG